MKILFFLNTTVHLLSQPNSLACNLHTVKRQGKGCCNDVVSNLLGNSPYLIKIESIYIHYLYLHYFYILQLNYWLKHASVLNIIIYSIYSQLTTATGYFY